MTAIMVIAHSFAVIGDVDDPEIYAAGPIYKWQQSEAGKWMMKNSHPPVYWEESLEHRTFNYRYNIIGYLTEKQHTFWKLKYA